VQWCFSACVFGWGVGDLLVRIWTVRRARLWSRSGVMGDGIERDIGYDVWMTPRLRRMDEAVAPTDG
jgi:hypothetical protein